jgi:hypothetical protein
LIEQGCRNEPPSDTFISPGAAIPPDTVIPSKTRNLLFNERKTADFSGVALEMTSFI